MQNNFKETSNRILALVHNARRMAVDRQNRRLAMDVLRACSLYVKGTHFPCDTKLLDNLASTIIDKQNSAIIEEFAAVEKTLRTAFAAAERRTWRTLRLPR